MKSVERIDSIILLRYRIKNIIGKGAYGIVWSAYDT